MNTVLVTAIGSFAADIVIKTLRGNGIRVIGCDIYPGEWVADAANVDAFYQVPCADSVAYVDEVLSICRREGVDGLFLLLDVEVDVWNDHRGALKELGITLCMSKPETIRICRDKQKLYEYLEERQPGILIPTRPLKGCDPSRLEYPVICKPRSGRSSQGLRRIAGQEQMAGLLAEVNGAEYILQPQVDGIVVTADVVRNQTGTKCAVICRREHLRTLNGAGTSVEIFREPQLEALCRDIAAALEIRGCVNFEFIEDGAGNYHMLECNPRFSGGVEFSCMAGYDCVMNHLRCFTGEEPEDCKDVKAMFIARKYEEYITKA